jgi:hypothetical protein
VVITNAKNFNLSAVGAISIAVSISSRHKIKRKCGFKRVFLTGVDYPARLRLKYCYFSGSMTLSSPDAGTIFLNSNINS